MISRKTQRWKFGGVTGWKGYLTPTIYLKGRRVRAVIAFFSYKRCPIKKKLWATSQCSFFLPSVAFHVVLVRLVERVSPNKQEQGAPPWSSARSRTLTTLLNALRPLPEVERGNCRLRRKGGVRRRQHFRSGGVSSSFIDELDAFRQADVATALLIDGFICYEKRAGRES